MPIRIAATAYALPPDIVSIESVFENEKARVETALGPPGCESRERILAGLGLSQVRVCGRVDPHTLAMQSARQALAEADLPASALDLIIDFSTLRGDETGQGSFAHKLSADLGAETSLNFSYRVGGCGGLHLALKTAAALMAADENLRSALLVASDTPPSGSRSMLPVTVQGDAASAVILRAHDGPGPEILATEAITLSHLHDAITIARDHIQVDSARIENAVKPIYYLNFHRLLHRALDKTSLKLTDVDHFIYSNISRADRDGFVKALRLPPERVRPDRLQDLGHTFASDLVINYTDLRRAGQIHPGEIVLFASAGIGFTWGVTLARA